MNSSDLKSQSNYKVVISIIGDLDKKSVAKINSNGFSIDWQSKTITGILHWDQTAIYRMFDDTLSLVSAVEIN